MEQEIYSSQNRRWAKAFEPLFRLAMADTKSLSSQRALLLKMHSLTMIIRLAGNCEPGSQVVFDKYTAEFEGIVRLARILLEGKKWEISRWRRL